MHTFLAAAVVIVVACSSKSDAPSPPPMPQPRTPAAMAPIDRYRDHLARMGADRNAAVVDSAGLALGDWHFFDVEGGTGAARAAVSPTGVVGANRDPGDAWHAFLAAGDAATLAARIAWLEGGASGGAGKPRRGPALIVVSGPTPAAAKIDPVLWRAATPPARDELPGGARRLTAWFYASGTDEPYRLEVTAPPDATAAFEVRLAHTLVDPGDPAARVTAALAGGDDPALRWALQVAAKTPMPDAAPAIAALLTRPDASLRADAAVALSSLRAAAAVEALAAACAKETDAVARWMMLSALGNIGNPAAIDALAALRARFADAATRTELVQALARASESTPAAAKAVLAAIAKDDADAAVRKLAASYAAP